MDCCNPAQDIELESGQAEHSLAVHGFVALWRGRRPRPGDLGADAATVDSLHRRGLIATDPEGRIAGIHGLSTVPTAHQIAHSGGGVHTWCAFDAVGIPSALALDARVRTTCPACGRHIEVDVTRGEPAGDPDLRLWLPTMQCDNVLDEVCAHANLYCNHEHLTAAITDPAAGGGVHTVPRAADLGRATWKDAATALQVT